MSFMETLLVVLISGVLGYYLGKLKELRESKQKIYSSITPIIAEMCYSPKIEKEKEYNTAILLSWLYSNKNVAKQLDKIASIIIDSSRGDNTKEIQKLIVDMRKDIQPLPWQKLKDSDVKHIYMRFTKRIEIDKTKYLKIIIDILITKTNNGQAPWLRTFGDDYVCLELNQGIIEIRKCRDEMSKKISFNIFITFEGTEYFNEYIYESDSLYLSVQQLYNLVNIEENNEFNKLLKAVENEDFKKLKSNDNYEDNDKLPF